MKKSTRIFLIILLLIVCVAPLYLKKDAEFGGADGMAEEAIVENNQDYEAWFEPIFEPASGEIESMLFASQAALGAGVIGYYFGRRKKQKANVDNR